jgi:type IV fimbrial biogenesis protein FimT
LKASFPASPLRLVRLSTRYSLALLQMTSFHCRTACGASVSTAGFTLIELMVTVTIAVILLSLAAPAFQAMVLNNRVTGLTDSLAIALNFARGTALKTAVPVRVCPIGASGSTNCGTDWSAGWMVVADPNVAPAVLQRSSAPVSAPTLLATAVDGSPLSGVSFDTHGLAGTAARFKVCDSRGAAYARSVQTLATGFVQAGSGPGQAAWGGTLSCP